MANYICKIVAFSTFQPCLNSLMPKPLKSEVSVVRMTSLDELEPINIVVVTSCFKQNSSTLPFQPTKFL